ncbi:MAG: 30S ribosomal protein S16 [Candidatus Taylorbacteria bacterium CG10_big_fil_rev_8_21_14_0_10_41_48]|uniref:Small ribosomal subunit protein bS16 n=1 Tax=Candidatus Taylorbacteria bacterium CG10_big_fil_rev_8_21_14_0_10_41_48 TaxID=1975024 RepID=A0A2M8LCB0_9BACT|nr:MAG: 30S ribosomal protein S16 [Candidatus Taylorbacteria bacterium CG10_big_fil_rev_8_21_14_0_10_41_48]
MLMIRLQRVGRVNVPTFRVVLTDSKNSTKSGRFLEILGMYDPVNDVKEIKVDRVKHWMSHGAQLSDTVHNWLIEKKVIPGKKINNLPKKSPVKKEGEEKAESAPTVSTPAPEPIPAEVPKVETAPEPSPAPEEPKA